MEIKKISFIRQTYMLYIISKEYFKEIEKYISVDKHIKENNYIQLIQNEKKEEYEKMYNTSKQLLEELEKYFNYKMNFSTLINFDSNKNNFEKLIELKKIDIFYNKIQKIKKEENETLIEYDVLKNEITFLEESVKDYKNLKNNLDEIQKNIDNYIKNINKTLKDEEKRYLNIITIFLTIFSILGVTAKTLISSNSIGINNLLIILGVQIFGVSTVYTLINKLEKESVIKIIFMLIISILLITFGICFK